MDGASENIRITLERTMTDPIFPNGIRVFPPNEGAPDFVKGALSIETNKFCAWLGQQPEPTVRLDIKLSRNGKWYLQLNTWKPKEDKKVPSGAGNPAQENVHDFSDDIPFITNAGIR